jgi:hypothetical protein
MMLGILSSPRPVRTNNHEIVKNRATPLLPSFKHRIVPSMNQSSEPGGALQAVVASITVPSTTTAPLIPDEIMSGIYLSE